MFGWMVGQIMEFTREYHSASSSSARRERKVENMERQVLERDLRGLFGVVDRKGVVRLNEKHILLHFNLFFSLLFVALGCRLAYGVRIMVLISLCVFVRIALHHSSNIQKAY